MVSVVIALLGTLLLTLFPMASQAQDVEAGSGKQVFRPFVGAIAGAWGGGDLIDTGVTGGLQAGVYGPSIGASFMTLYYNESIRLVPLMANVFFRIPIRHRKEFDPVTFRVGGGATYFLISPRILSDIGSQANIGVDFWLTSKIAIALDGFYFFFNSAADSNSGELPYASALLLMSVKYRFR